MINKLVFENLRHRWVRTLLSALVIGVQVMSILTLIGLSDGLLQDSANRQKGTGADIFLKPESGPATFSFGSGQVSDKVVQLVSRQPHVVSAIGVLGEPVELITTVQGVDIDALKKMSGGIPMVSGRLPSAPDDLLVDQFYADQNHLHPGQKWKLLNHEFTVSGVMQGGLLGHLIVLLPTLQRLTSQTGKVSQILVKLDNPALTNQEVNTLNQLLKGDMRAYSMQAILSNFNINNIPELKIFIRVIEGLAILVGFLVVFLSMYTAVIERTREIGILKALGAKPGTILDMLVRESLVLALLGSVIGILFAIGAKSLLPALMPSLVIVNVPGWWPVAALIAIIGALFGASYPGLKAARQDAIEALSYD
ncbi:MAG TPA: ABC transporter permease [Bryobacteraceae bacterium]|jgi:putative ABC transport system permease protein|nr:ABC transporter permease [Bryobacteraceae bacterium]